MGPVKCLLCRQPGGGSLSRSCGGTVCTVFGLPTSHPFKEIFDRGKYCDYCVIIVEQATSLIEQLEEVKQKLLQFQSKTFSILSDNYFQIENREKLTVNCDLFDKEVEFKKRRFKYDEIVKVLYEKFNNNCLSWETFATSGSSPPVSSKADCSTQTDLEEPSSPPASPPHDTHDDLHDESPMTPDPLQEEVVGGEDDDSQSTANVPDYDLPFLKKTIDLSKKIYCQVDPENCKRFFFNKFHLSVHVASYHEKKEQPYICPVCNRGFNSEHNLKEHFLRLHDQTESCLCPECGKCCPSQISLKDHLRCHDKKTTGTSKPRCSLCSLEAPAEELPVHEALHGLSTEPFACVLCPNLSFKSQASLRGHVAQKHNSGSLSCDVCGKMFSKQTTLRYHLLSHAGQFTCEQCGIQCSSPQALKDHQLTHTGEKPFTCDQCGQSFRTQKQLTSHTQVHTGEKPFSCNTCGRAFRTVSFLRRHEESHSTEYPYGCDRCHRKFRVKVEFYKHKKTHLPGYVARKRKRYPRTELEKIRRREREQAKRMAQRRDDEWVDSGRQRVRKYVPKKKKVKEELVVPDDGDSTGDGEEGSQRQVVYAQEHASYYHL